MPRVRIDKLCLTVICRCYEVQWFFVSVVIKIRSFFLVRMVLFYSTFRHSPFNHQNREKRFEACCIGPFLVAHFLNLLSVTILFPEMDLLSFLWV